MAGIGYRDDDLGREAGRVREIYCGAGSEEQAWYVYRPQRKLCEHLPKLRKTYKSRLMPRQLVGLNDLSRFTPIIGNPGDGASPYLWNC